MAIVVCPAGPRAVVVVSPRRIGVALYSPGKLYSRFSSGYIVNPQWRIVVVVVLVVLVVGVELFDASYINF